MEIEIKDLKYATLTKINIKENEINVILGKNNIGKTNLLKSIHNFYQKNKNIESFFLDLSLNPFDDLAKEPPDMNKTKEKIPNSYYLIKEKFENIDFSNIENKIKNLIMEELDFVNKQDELRNELELDRFGISLEIKWNSNFIFFKKTFYF